jgi:hypothetical protein
MSGQTAAPHPGAQRVIPPLPAGIPILPGQARAGGARSRLRRPTLLLVIAGIVALFWFFQWYSSYDGKRINAIVTPAMYAHVKYGTRFEATLWGGPRILQISSAYVQEGVVPPTTCVAVVVLDPKKGARDPSYKNNYFDCISGLSYTIPYPSAR